MDPCLETELYIGVTNEVSGRQKEKLMDRNNFFEFSGTVHCKQSSQKNQAAMRWPSGTQIFGVHETYPTGFERDAGVQNHIDW
jgi:hypothetical protein